MADGQAAGQSYDPESPEQPGKISLVTTHSPAASSWTRSIFNLDFGFRNLMLLAALTVLGIVFLIVKVLLEQSALAWHKLGIHFFFGSQWDPVSGSFGALPFVYGTLVSSLIALVIAVPLAIAVAQ